MELPHRGPGPGRELLSPEPGAQRPPQEQQPAQADRIPPTERSRQVSKFAQLQAALAALPDGDFAITAPVTDMLAVCGEAGAESWLQLAAILSASITVDGVTNLFKIAPNKP